MFGNGWKWCFKNSHKNGIINQGLSVHRDRKGDNFYRITKLIGYSSVFIVVALFSLALPLSFTISRAARAGRQNVFHKELSWAVKASCKSAHLFIHTCLFPALMNLRELVFFPSTEEKFFFFFFLGKSLKPCLDSDNRA